MTSKNPVLITIPGNVQYTGDVTPIIPKWQQHLKTPDDNPVAADEFDGDTIDSNWTLIQPSGSQTVVQNQSLISIKMTSTFTSSDVAAYVQPLPAGSTYPMTIEVCAKVYSESLSSFYAMFGPVFCDGTSTGSNIAYCMAYPTSLNAVAVNGRTGTFTAAGSATHITADVPFYSNKYIYLRIIWSASNTFKIAFSPDGITWYTSGTAAKTMTPTHFGITWTSWGNAITTARWITYEYIRVYDSELT